MTNVLKFYGFEFSSASHASPELSSAQSCFKGTLTIVNLIFLIFGCILCGVGAYALQTKAGSLAGETLPTGIIVLGVFIILVSFLGCLSAFRESRCLLGLYFTFLLIFVIILMAIGVGVYAKKDSASVYMSEGWCEASKSVQADIQTYFQCCGLYSYNDSMARYDAYLGPIAAACAIIAPERVPKVPLACPANVVQSNGLPCLPILQSSFESSYVAAGACAIAFAVIMGAGMCIVCVLMSGIKEKRHLEDIRKLHRKLREAKEDPTHAGLAGLSPRDGGDSGYGESELSTVGDGAAGVIGMGGLDQEVHLQMDEEPASYAAGTIATTATKKSKKSKAAVAKPRYEPEESVEEEDGGYGQQPAAGNYEDEESVQGGGVATGYAQHDEYDEEEN